MKKKILIFCGLFLLAVLLGFITLSVAKNTSKETIEEKNGRVIKDFIDVDSNVLEDNISDTKTDSKPKDIVNAEKDEDVLSTNTDLEISDNNIFYDATTNEFIDEIGDVPISEIYPESVINSIQDILANYELSDIDNVKVASQEDIEFFNSIKEAADNYVLAYDEASSFIFTGDLSSLKTFVNGSFTDAINSFAEIPTNGNRSFENIKSIYLEGMNLTKEGFLVYLKDTQSEECNKYFLKADDKFFEGQEELKNILADYTIE